MELYRKINMRMSAKPAGTVTFTPDKSRPFSFNGTEPPGAYYDLVDNPLIPYEDEILHSYPIKLLKDFGTSEKTLCESLLPALDPAIPGAPQRDQGYLWQYLLLAAVSQDRVKQVLAHITEPLEDECKRLRKLEQGGAIWCGVRAMEWEQCVEELESIEVMQGKVVRAFGEKWMARQRATGGHASNGA